jgi:hypothetical protein
MYILTFPFNYSLYNEVKNSSTMGTLSTDGIELHPGKAFQSGGVSFLYL